MKKYKQKHIAQKANLSDAFISEIINGKKRPHYKTAKRIASATNTDPILWLEGSPDEIRQALNKEPAQMSNEITITFKVSQDLADLLGRPPLILTRQKVK